MTTILDLQLFDARRGGPVTRLHFALDGDLSAKEALDEIAPGAAYDQLGLPANIWPDRTVGELVRWAMPGGWVAIPCATVTDSGGCPRITFAEHLRGADLPPLTRREAA